MKFNGSKHMVAYCMAILKNREIKPSTSDVKAFNSIGYILNYLDELKSMNIIYYNPDALFDSIVEDVKGGKFEKVIGNIRWVINKIKSQTESNSEYGYIIKSIDYRFMADLHFTDDFMHNHQNSDMYPKTIKALIKYDKTSKIQPYIKTGKNTESKSGVYFIYDKDGKLAYIGMSGVVDQRCLQSVLNKGLYDFTKIEIYSTKTRADALIYETYFIHELSPYMNRPTKKDKDTAMETILPKLSITRVIQKSSNLDCIEFNYSYFKESTIDTHLFTNCVNGSVLINSEKNRGILLNKGYEHGDYHPRLIAYQNKVEEIKADSSYSNCHMLVCDEVSSCNSIKIL